MAKNRVFVTDSVLQSSVALTVEALKRRAKKHGVFSYIGPHETLGIITEEYQELIGAIHDNNREETKSELIDIAVSCIFGLASLNQQDIDGENSDKIDPNDKSNPSIALMLDQIEKDYQNIFNGKNSTKSAPV